MKNYSKIFTFLFLIVVISAITIFLYNCNYTNDDWWTCFFYKSLKKEFLSADQGQVWSWFAMKIVTQIIPSVFHFHPQHNIILQAIKGINICIAVYLLSLYFKLPQKEVPNCGIVSINTLMILLPIIFYSNTVLVFVNIHYKYLFILILGTIIWLIWFREFLNGEFLENGKKIRDSVFGFILAFCGHIVSIPSLFMLAFIYLYKIIQNGNSFKAVKQVFNKNYLLFLILPICMAIDFHLPGFTYIKDAERSVSEPVIKYFITHFFEYTKELFIYIMQTPYICYPFILAIAGLIGLIIYRKKIDIKYTVIAFSIFISFMLFEYSLLICGRTFYNHESFWFVSREVSFTFIYYLLLVCNVTWGRLYEIMNKNIVKLAFVILFLLTLFIIYPFKTLYDNLERIHYTIEAQNIDMYKINKLFSYYSYKDGTIYIPVSYYNSINKFNRYWIAYDSINLNMKNIYGINHNRTIEKLFCGIKNESKFFTKEELQNINYNKLFDRNFVMHSETPVFDCNTQ